MQLLFYIPQFTYGLNEIILGPKVEKRLSRVRNNYTFFRSLLLSWQEKVRNSGMTLPGNFFLCLEIFFHFNIKSTFCAWRECWKHRYSSQKFSPKFLIAWKSAFFQALCTSHRNSLGCQNLSEL